MSRQNQPVQALQRPGAPAKILPLRPPSQRPYEQPRRERAGLLAACSNPACDTGWLHLLRSRTAPVFEAGWCCSPACTLAQIESALRRELEGRSGGAEAYRHRIPLGLVMLEQGWISSDQLRRALDGQKAAGAGRLGRWLVGQQGVSEDLVTRALSLQWNCPVLPLDAQDEIGLAPLIPRFFLSAFGVLPLRVAADRLLYLGFEDRLDRVLALAIERITGLRVESGMVIESRFRPAHGRMLEASFPAIELVEAVSPAAAGRSLARAVERARPVESRLVRVHDCLWLRMWTRRQVGPIPDLDGVQDVICATFAH